ncbi:MAG: ATP-binding cassette domain-containing protein [Treponema sp.]|jgi:energy-coupling factor transport system ATP-binding protein|nr:ATP-binding cassette domain-containing protein [Treponema sp.]
MAQIINIENVYYSYPRKNKWALENINLSIEEGEFLAVMGENGAGKTTLLRLINGIIPHSSQGRFLGSVKIDGERTDTSSVARLALKVGMVLDDPDAQIFTSSVFGEAAFGPENLLLPESEIIERVEFALSAVGLLSLKDRQPATLSGGEKQRLAIACALAMKGRILVLDEPLARLDPQGEAEVMSVVRDICQKYQITVIMASHDSEKMAESADRVCVLKDGRVAVCDTARKIFADSALLEENGIQPPCAVDINAVFSLKKERLSGAESGIPAIEIKNFCYYYGDGARIENINISIKDNDFTAIIGNNGCGKTTLLKNITGLLRPSGGDIFIRGKNVKELTVSGISKEIGFVMQNPDNQLFTDSVFNEVSFALKNMRLSKKEIDSRVQDALCAVGLKDADAFPHALSRADRTKTLVACVLAMGCKIIIFDEVDAGQDYKSSRHIMNLARELWHKGFTILFVTHNMSLACEYAHKLVIMNRNGTEYFEK